MKKTIVRFFALAMCLWFFSGCAFAVEAQGVEIIFAHDGEYIQDADFSLYYLGSVSSGRITPDESFSPYKVSFDISDSEKMASLAETLRAYVLRDNIAPDHTDSTDSNGKADFGGAVLPEGAYLAMAEKHYQNGTYYFCKPIILVIPYGETDTLIITPKFETVPEGPESSDVSYRVLKVWLNDEEGTRPTEIQVQLLRDGEVYDTVTLSAENNWKYRWDNLPSEYHWTVTEKNVDERYVVSLSCQEKVFLLTNKGDKDSEETTAPEDENTTVPSTSPDDTTNPDDTTTDSDETTKPDSTTDPDQSTTKPEEELPVTGVLRWPIPYLAMAGVFLFIVGYVKYRKSELENE